MRLILMLTASAAAAFGGGCASGPRSTQTTLDDVEVMTAEMASDLRTNLLLERTPASPPMRVAITKVRNNTRHIMGEGEQWAIMDRVAKSIPLSTLRDQANIQFVVERDLLDQAQERGTIPLEAARARGVTHVMQATFDAPTRQAGENRTDLYLCRFSVMDLQFGEEVWAASFDFKRDAIGKAYD